MPISADEFERWMRLLQKDIQGVNDRLDTLNGRTRDVETKVAVLEDRAKRGAVIATGAATAVAALIEGVHVWLSK